MHWGVFGEADPRLLERVEGSSVVRSYNSGDVVFRQGDVGQACYVVQTGHFEADVTTIDGDIMPLRIHPVGSHFGDISLLDQRLRRTATVKAMEGASALVISGEAFAELRTSAGVEQALIAKLVDLVVLLTAESTDNAYLSTERRLAKRLLSLASIYGGASARKLEPVTIPMSQEHLATAIGATRSTVNRMLGDLERTGVLRRSRSRIVILDQKALASASES